MVKIYTALFFLFLKICGLVCNENTTYYNVHPEQDRYKMQVYGVSSEPSVDRYPVEKIRNGNRESCEKTNLKNTLSPSSRGRLYPIDKSGDSFFMWFVDSNYFTVDVSKSCSSLLLENINMVRNQHMIAYLKDFLKVCHKGIVIRDVLCDPYKEYSTRLIENFIPYFSDVKIYFIDYNNHCTASFNTFVETNNNIVTNKDISWFLTNQTRCSDKIYFTNQINIQFSLQSISNTHSIINAFLMTHTGTVGIFFILKYQTCKEQFIHDLFSTGVHVSKNDTFRLSLNKIMSLTDGNTCYEIYLSCSAWGRYTESTAVDPSSTISYIISTVAMVVILVNSFVLFIFLQKENRTPVTILLSSLAISDSMTALLMTIQALIVHQKYGHHIYNHNAGVNWYQFEFAECFIDNAIFNLMFSFHFVSILLTTLLCLQKTSALLFPMWSKSHISNRRNALCSIIIFIFSFCLFTAIFSVQRPLFIEPINGRCCVELEYISHGLDISLYLIIFVYGCSILACLVVVLCTIYIICKLTIMRRNLPWTDSSITQKRHRTSALTVVVICIIFLLSETVVIVRLLAYTLSTLKILNVMPLFTRLTNYNDLSLLIGFSLNFIIYLVMSSQIRDKLRRSFVKLLRSFKCW